MIYGYCVRDPFIIFANVPGLMCALWMNFGATKIQYMNVIFALTAPIVSPEGETLEEKDSHKAMILREFLMTPQERILFTLLFIWTLVLVVAGFFTPVGNPGTIVGIAVNINYIAYYAAPLEKMKQVIQTGDASPIHVPTMILSFSNAVFWVVYGYMHNDLVLLLPSAIGAVLAMCQGFLLFRYRPYRAKQEELEPLRRRHGNSA